jgi:DNA polymerase-3 subunit epsilon
VELHLTQVTFPGLQVLTEWASRFNPEMPIPAQATRLHGIRDEEVAKEPRFAETAEWLQRLLRRHVLIAYNGRRFDVPLLHNELVRCGQEGLPAGQFVIDPYELFQQDIPRTLTGAVHHYLGEAHPEAHTARGDVHAMLRVLGQQLRSRDPTLVLEGLKRTSYFDRAGCFYQEPDGVIRFGFGKHRGEPVAGHPDYLQWILGADFEPRVKRLARDFLIQTRGSAPGPGGAA